ncbi:hypothetical protein FIBSPDRAFT_963878 [Athelia psychrophila]|uniref:Uncharacterized protein n=1 Tax=Athelia psychrophila TaxID=1759441 RepID=A0A165YI61_9AGAM|nr:hypothetical protein FIBSPDRAFT_963878 [Fibularhizoctonia sp. CBS 109695]
MSSATNKSFVVSLNRRSYAFFRGKITAQRLSICPGKILHYDAAIGDIVPWSCPSIYGVAVHPKYWGRYAADHDFKNPSCTCPAELPEGSIRYTECVVEQELAGRNKGKWIARCAVRRCGYYVSISDCHNKAGFLHKSYPLREPRAEATNRIAYGRLALMQDSTQPAIFDLLRLDSSERPGLTMDQFYRVFTICKCDRIMTRRAFGRHLCKHIVVDLTATDSEDSDEEMVSEWENE